MGSKPTVIFDFDGVIHSYTSGWKGSHVISDLPVKGIKELIERLRHQYRIVVVSSRCSYPGGEEAIREYLDKHNIEVDGVQSTKPPAILTVDDRCVCFKGDVSLLEKEIVEFEHYIKR